MEIQYIQLFQTQYLRRHQKKKQHQAWFHRFFTKIIGGEKMTNFMLPNAKSMAPKGPFLHV